MPAPLSVSRTFLLALGLLTPDLAPAAEPTADVLPRLAPLPPDQALASFTVRPGFRLELAAHEPQVVDPIALSFDEHGRLYVLEMRDYSERRPERLGRVRRLEDRDADGHFETSTVFLDQLPWPTAITCWDGGVFIGATPDLLFARDEDGDGRADLRETIFTGFASGFAPYATNQLNVQAMMNNLQWGLDARIHGSASFSGGIVELVDSPFTRAWRQKGGAQEPWPEPLDLRGKDFSFDPHHLSLRLEIGGGQHGMTFDNHGRKYLCSNSDHIQTLRYSQRHAARPSLHPLPPAKVSIADDGPAAQVFRLSPEEPWRIVRTRWRVTGLVAGLIEGGGRSSGYFTSATGIEIHRGDHAADLLGDAFIADCGSNLIHRKRIRTVGLDRHAARVDDEIGREFLASKDTWFRPVQLANGPDGALWIADMYREIIEHPWSIPPGLKQRLDLNSGNDRGRLYRVLPENSRPRNTPPVFPDPPADLVRLLGHANGWHRDTAARLLYQQRDPATSPLLLQALRDAPSPLTRLHALHLLHALNLALPSSTLALATGDANPTVRAHAVAITGERYAGQTLPPDLVAAWEARFHDAAEVRLEIALALASVRHPRHTESLARLLSPVPTPPGQSLLVEAVLSAAGDHSLSLYLQLVPPSLNPSHPAAADLAALIARRQRPDEIQTVTVQVSRTPPSPDTLRILARFADALRDANIPLASLHAQTVLEPYFDAARRWAADPAAIPADTRRDALRLVLSQSLPSNRPLLLAILERPLPFPLHQTALEGLFRIAPDPAWKDLLERWTRLTPDTRSAALALVLRRPEGPGLVLDAIDAGRLPPRDLSAAQLETLRQHADTEIRERTRQLFGEPAPSRAEAIARYLPALDRQGQADRGRIVFREQCATCHRLGGEGHLLGPDLETVQGQPREKLLVAILDPNREVSPLYLTATADTHDGESLSGWVASEDASTLTLRQAGGIEHRLPRTRIESLRFDSRSLMPEGFESTLTPEAMADLLALLSPDG
jgi:putative membrane-bound dehydrogenase-like protein